MEIARLFSKVLKVCLSILVLSTVAPVFAEDLETAYTVFDIGLRSSPDFSGHIVERLPSRAKVKIINEHQFWFKVETESGKKGWLAAKWLRGLDGQDLELMLKKIKIEALEKKVRPIPASNAEANLDIYLDLAILDPDNPKYKKKVTYYLSKIEATEKEKREKQQKSSTSSGSARLKVDRVWVDGDYGYALVTYTNKTSITFKSGVTIRCVALDYNGNKINVNKRSFYVHEYGPIIPGFEDTIKVPVELHGISMESMRCNYREW